MSLAQPFADARGPLRAIDPRARLLGAAVFSGTVAALTDLRVLGAAAGVSVLLLAGVRPRPGMLVRRLLAANGFIAFLWFFLPWSVPGTALWQCGPLVLTAEGLSMALTITVKCNAILGAMIALLSTAPARELATAMSRLRLPGRLVTLFYLTVRYVHVVHAERVRMTQAATVRGFRPRADLHTYRTIAGMLGHLLLRSLDRAERVYAAMRCRGFTGRFPRFAHRAARAADWGFLVGLCAMSAGLGCWQWLLTR